MSETEESWVNQFGTLSTYITKNGLEILNDHLLLFSFYIRSTVKALIGVSTNGEQPLGGALNPQEKPQKRHRRPVDASSTLLFCLDLL